MPFRCQGDSTMKLSFTPFLSILDAVQIIYPHYSESGFDCLLHLSSTGFFMGNVLFFFRLLLMHQRV
uniref:Uncharacterized protein n=1 Tax=uncultured Poribacteria bacterium 64K2 TaxID=309182 RepID=Q24M40_9BACT|nr:hypothetical protein [uncultured Poribacteria bacterium 64K2]